MASEPCKLAVRKQWSEIRTFRGFFFSEKQKHFPILDTAASPSLGFFWFIYLLPRASSQSLAPTAGCASRASRCSAAQRSPSSRSRRSLLRRHRQQLRSRRRPVPSWCRSRSAVARTACGILSTGSHSAPSLTPARPSFLSTGPAPRRPSGAAIAVRGAQAASTTRRRSSAARSRARSGGSATCHCSARMPLSCCPRRPSAS